jgi:hypothetical protein
MRSRWAALAAVAGIVVLLGGCSDNTPPFNATPVLQNIFPSNITAGSSTFTLFIQGTGFIADSMGVSFAYWNGSPRSTFLNTTTGQLQVQIPASDVAIATSADVTVVNPAPGGGMSVTPLIFNVVSPLAGLNITSLSPPSTAVGGPAFALTINGTGFNQTDVVTWNGSVRTTVIQPMNSTVAVAQITQNDISTEGTASIAVNAPNLVTATPAVNFAITGGSNPMPSIGGLSPSTIATGSPDLQVTVNGSGFTATSVVELNSSPRATAYINGGDLVVLIPATDLANSGSPQIVVVNPPPGGGTSSGATLTIK